MTSKPKKPASKIAKLRLQDFANIVQNAGEAILIYQDRKIIFVNDKSLEMSGLNREEIIGKDIFDFIPKEDHDKIMRRVASRVDGDSSRERYEIQLLNIWGEKKDYWISSNILDFDGQKCVLVFLTDITPQKKIAAALLKSEAKYRQLIEEAHDAILLSDQHGNFFEVNPRTSEIFGYTKQELLSMNIRELIFSKDMDLKPLRLEELVAGQVVTTQRELRRKDGSEFTAEVSGKMLADGTIQGTVRDLTERKDAEKRFRLIVEGTSNVIGTGFLKDLVKYLATALEVKYALVTEKHAGNLESAFPLALWAGDDYEEMPAYFLDNTPCGEVWSKKSLVISNDVTKDFPDFDWLKQHKVKSYIGLPLLDSNRHFIGHLAVMHTEPINDVIMAESTMRIFGSRAGAELERKQTEEKLTQLYDMQSKLFSSIAHSLKTPFSVIKSNINLLEKDLQELKPEDMELLEGIRTSATMANEKVTHLLKVAQLDMTPALATDDIIDLDDTVRTIVQQGKYLFQSYNTNVDRHVIDEHLKLDASSHVKINADVKGFTDLVLTLLDNAFKHSPRPNQLPEITVRTYRKGNVAMVEIMDDGKGIPAEHLAHIFDLYYQVDSKRGGFGIGLAFCKKMSEALGGGIAVESKVGAGTTFRVSLPVREL